MEIRDNYFKRMWFSLIRLSESFKNIGAET